MKAIRFILIGLLAVIFSSANAESPARFDNKIDALLKEFIESQVNSDPILLKKVLANDAVIKIPFKNDVMALSKAQFVEMVRNAGSANQNCTSSFEIIDADNTMFSARIDLKYEGFLVQNFIKAEKMAGDVWKITEFSKVFVK